MRRHLIIDFRDAWAEVRDFLMIALGTALYCTGVVVFMLPYGLTTGGVSGLAMITFYSTGIPVQFTYFSVNILFLLAAVKVLGWRFCIKTIFGVSAATFWLWLFQLVIQNPVTHQLPRIVGDEMFMACVLGSIIEGIGLSFCFLHNGSMGGTDIIAAMVAKYSTVSFGRTMMYCDVLIICSSYLLFHSIDKIVYGLIFMVIYSVAADRVINNTRQSVQFLIISKKWKEIADNIIQEAHRGCTILEGTGWYTKDHVKIVMVMCRKHESVNIFRIIKETDREAIITQSNVNGVYGTGFDELKVRIKKNREHHDHNEQATNA